MAFITTLNQIRNCHPCEEGWTTLLRSLNKTKADDESLNLLQVLASNGPYDCIWCFEAVKDKEREIRLFAVWCARFVLEACGTRINERYIDLAERYANGKADIEELTFAGYGIPEVNIYSMLLRPNAAFAASGVAFHSEHVYAEHKGFTAMRADRDATYTEQQMAYNRGYEKAMVEFRAILIDALCEMLSKED